MKCKKCGYRTKDINGMRKHYMKAHPAAMKHHGARKGRKGDVYSLVVGLSPQDKKIAYHILQGYFEGD